MNRPAHIIAAIAQQAQQSPDAIALESTNCTLSYADLMLAIESLAQHLRQHNVQTIALLADNGPAWCIADLACLHAEITLIPIPHFFTPSQMSHLIHSAGTDAILCQQAEHLLAALTSLHIKHANSIDLTINDHLALSLLAVHVPTIALPDACAKITFTSGSTGEAKGVCLQASIMHTVSASLAHVTAAHAGDRHIALLPYATLLENIGGLYAPLLSGATVVSPSLAEVGLSGSSGLDVQRFVGILIQSKATTCIMIPQMLHALVAAIEAGAPTPQTLRFIAVGGAPVSKQLLQRAEQLGLPVYEGYGLSEASSVVAVNCPTANKIGSVGKVLAHAEVSFADDGEIYFPVISVMLLFQQNTGQAAILDTLMMMDFCSSTAVKNIFSLPLSDAMYPPNGWNESWVLNPPLPNAVYLVKHVHLMLPSLLLAIMPTLT